MPLSYHNNRTFIIEFVSHVAPGGLIQLGLTGYQSVYHREYAQVDWYDDLMIVIQQLIWNTNRRHANGTQNIHENIPDAYPGNFLDLLLIMYV